MIISTRDQITLTKVELLILICCTKTQARQKQLIADMDKRGFEIPQSTLTAALRRLTHYDLLNKQPSAKSYTTTKMGAFFLEIECRSLKDLLENAPN